MSISQPSAYSARKSGRWVAWRQPVRLHWAGNTKASGDGSRRRSPFSSSTATMGLVVSDGPSGIVDVAPLEMFRRHSPNLSRKIDFLPFGHPRLLGRTPDKAMNSMTSDTVRRRPDAVRPLRLSP